MPRERKYTSKAEKQKAYRQRKAEALRNADVLRNKPELVKVERPPVRYFGGKWRLADWIMQHFPAEHRCYVEAFAGGASVLLQKPHTSFEVLNDLDGDVINFFDMLRSRTEELIRAIWLTPYSREEWRRARDQQPAADPIERARRFYVRCWQSFGSGTGIISTGWRFQKGANESGRADAVKSWNSTEHLWAVAERLKLVQIENDDALVVMKRYDGPKTLFYLDPPYVHSTRYESSHRKGYQHEMADADHRHFAETARQLQGMVIVSGYPCDLYDELFHDWQCVTKESADLNANMQTECLWLSPSVSRIENLPLFA